MIPVIRLAYRDGGKGPIWCVWFDLPDQEFFMLWWDERDGSVHLWDRPEEGW